MNKYEKQSLDAPSGIGGADVPKKLSPAAQRALAEAEQRRKAAQAERQKELAERPKEIDGRGGLDPVRYGDWEVKGLTSDF